MIDRDDLELFERSLRDATEAHTGSELDAGLDEIGWRDALGADARVAVSLLFDLQGRANATSSALDHLALDALGVTGGVGVVLPALGAWRAPGMADGDRVSVQGLGSAGIPRAARAVVVRVDGDQDTAVNVPTAELDVRAIRGVDPGSGIVAVSGACAGEEIGPVDWQAVVRRCQVALAHELVGASRQMLELARRHALERIQFGVPIASFQAVRHRLAEALVAIETAEAAIEAAWIDDTWHHATIAKALAGRGARTTARHCQQVLAGIGFTLEHSFHRYFRRVLVLDELFGASRTLTRDFGRELVRTGQLPHVLPL
jgi:hypothetical protein